MTNRRHFRRRYLILGVTLLVLVLARLDLLATQAISKITPMGSDSSRAAWVQQAVFVTRVVDGDTFWVKTATGEKIKVRILGIDAPEICQAYGQAAKQALRQKIEKRKVDLHGIQNKDKYGRLLAVPVLQEEDVAAWLVRTGNAWNDIYKGRHGRYSKEQDAAKHTHMGVWALLKPKNPSDFRRHHGPCTTKK